MNPASKDDTTQPITRSTPSSLSAKAPVFVPSSSLTKSEPAFLAGRPAKADIYSHPYLLALREKLKARRTLTLAEIGQLYPSEDLASLGHNKWAYLLELPEVQIMLNADLIAAGTRTPAAMLVSREGVSANSQASENLTPDEINSLDDDRLRYLWKLRWKQSLEDFCKTYDCNQGNFSSWLHKRRLTSLPSSGAIRRWLREKYCS